MQTANEIKSAVENIRYYNQRIKELSKKQLEMDCEQGNRIGINVQVGTIRFDCLGAVNAACSYLDIYCDNIQVNLKMAIEQDKLLYSQD